MSRDPLAVLRALWLPMGLTSITKEMRDEAILKVEALVRTANAFHDAVEIMTNSHGGEYDDLISPTVESFEEALDAFTPGQDSEGGGHA